jgi:hypothetical protein
METWLISLLSVIVGAVASVGAKEFMVWRRRPIIKMRVGREIPYVCDTLVTDRIIHEQSVPVRWLRLGVENEGRRVAYDCQVFLTKIELLKECGQIACTTPLNNPLALKWVGTEETKRNLPAKVRLFLDFLVVSEKYSYPEPAFETIDAQFQQFLNVATLENVVFTRFHFVATANEVQNASFYADVDCRLSDADDKASPNHWAKFNWR